MISASFKVVEVKVSHSTTYFMLCYGIRMMKNIGEQLGTE